MEDVTSSTLGQECEGRYVLFLQLPMGENFSNYRHFEHMEKIDKG